MSAKLTQHLRGRPILWAAAFYVALTCICTWPQALRIHDGLPADTYGQRFEDPFLNSWILAWGARAAVTDPLHIFDTNAFWPRRNTLAYSDHMLGYLPLTIPAFWLAGNAILVHNLVLLLTFAGSGLAAFVLVRSITGSTGPALLAGVVYAFCPFRFEEYGHVQVLSSQWMPLALYCLHRCHARMDAGETFPWAAYLGFIGFGALQSLCSTYYSLFFPLFIGCFAAASCVFCAGPAKLKKAGLTLLAPVLWTALILPTVMPYVKLKREMGFRRDLHQNIEYSAKLGSFLAAPAANTIYGAWTARFGGPEAAGFPGAFTYVLSLAAVLWLIRSRAWRAEAPKACRWGWVYLLCGLAAAALAMGPRIRLAGREIGWGPYMLLYEFVPGFAGLRAPGRLLMLVMLCFSVLAGLGAHRLCSPLQPKWRGRLAVGSLIAILVAEFASFPVRLLSVPVWRQIPEVYQWLSRQRPEKRIVEVPLDLGLQDMERMYYSTYHWHKLVNGKSGYFPPETTAKYLSYVAPLPGVVRLMREMNIDYVITHDWLMDGARLSDIYRRVPSFRLVKSFGATHVFRLLHEAAPQAPAPIQTDQLVRVPRHRCKLMTNDNPEQAERVLDRDPATYWLTDGDQRQGMFFCIALDRLRPVRLVRVGLGLHAEELPQYMVVRVTQDGREWTQVFGRAQWPDMVASVYRSALANPLNPEFTVSIPHGNWRGIEMQLVKDAYAGWAMAEVQVYEEAQP